MVQNFDVCVRGGGVVGSSLALLLARDRLRVGLVAKSPVTGTTPQDVRAYALNHASMELLKSLRCWPADNSATPVLGMHVKDASGGEVTFSASDQGVQSLAWIVDVASLESHLSEAIRFQPLIEVIDCHQDASLTVICEGKASLSRSRLDVDFQIFPYAQHAIAARLNCEIGHHQVAQQWFSQGEILAFLPLDGPDGKTVAVVWSVSIERAAKLMAMTPDDFCRELQGFSHSKLGELALCSDRAAWPLQKAQTDRWIGSEDGKPWALAGDAAHNVHPLAGQGLNLGLADVAELSKVLRERDYWRPLNDLKLLRQYERSRKAGVLTMEAGIDALQLFFTEKNGVLTGLRKFGMNNFNRSGTLKHWITQMAMGV